MTSHMNAQAPVLSRRQKIAGINHHLWNNHGIWWFHGTVHLPNGTAERVRLSLRTRHIENARSRRDQILKTKTQHDSV